MSLVFLFFILSLSSLSANGIIQSPIRNVWFIRSMNALSTTVIDVP